MMTKHWYHDPKWGCYRVIRVTSNGGEYCSTHVHDDYGNLVRTSPIKVLRYGLQHSH